MFALCWVGEAISSFLPFLIPGTVISILLLLMLLIFRVLKKEKIQKSADFLLGNMGLFFVPAGVGLLRNIQDIRNFVGPVLFIIVVSTILTFLFTAFSVLGVVKLQQRFDCKKCRHPGRQKR